jgi:hypothetical protein
MAWPGEGRWSRPWLMLLTLYSAPRKKAFVPGPGVTESVFSSYRTGAGPTGLDCDKAEPLRLIKRFEINTPKGCTMVLFKPLTVFFYWIIG